MVGHRSEESEGLRFDSSWELRIFSLYHARYNNKTSFLISYIANVLLLCRSYKLQNEETCYVENASLIKNRDKIQLKKEKKDALLQ